MVWIESHDDLLDHPKTVRAARTLGVAPVHLAGHLHALWWWCMSYAEDGDLGRFDEEDVASAARFDGDPQEFIEALIECGPGESSGFLDVDDDGGLSIHDWDDYAGKLIQRREANRERMQRARAEHVQDTNGARAEHVQDTNGARAEHVQRTERARAEHVQRTERARAEHVQRTERARAERPDPTVPTEPDLIPEAVGVRGESEGGKGASDGGGEDESDRSDAERFVAGCVQAVKGAASIPAPEIIDHVRECLDIRGSPLSELTMRREFQKFRDYWRDQRQNQPANKRWRGWRKAISNWIERIEEPPGAPASGLDFYPDWDDPDVYEQVMGRRDDDD